MRNYCITCQTWFTSRNDRIEEFCGDACHAEYERRERSAREHSARGEPAPIELADGCTFTRNRGLAEDRRQ